MSYTTNDFSESLHKVCISAADVECVLAAWGSGDGQGRDGGKGWSAEVKAPAEFYSGEPHDWDESPADLNKWLADGAKDPYDE